MQYMGSKRLIAKNILPIILKNRTPEQVYVEPFVGGGNLIEHVANPRIGGDDRKESILALKIIRDNPASLPKNNTEFTEQDYQSRGKNFPEEIQAFASTAYSFGAVFWSAWARGKCGRDYARDYVREAYNNARKQSSKLQGLELYPVCYTQLGIPTNSIIYCDPPYRGVTQYKTKFNSDAFWIWCSEKVKEGHHVFVSEYNAPCDWVSVWKKEVKITINNVSNKKNKQSIEKLFVHKSQVHLT